MTNRERIKAIFTGIYNKDYDRLPVVHFGYWEKTLEKWCDEKHIKRSEIGGLSDGNEKDRTLAEKLGFDFNWQTIFGGNTLLMPGFEREILEELPDGKLKVINTDGLIVLEKPGVISIPAQVDYLLKNRKVWEDYYLPKLQYTDERVCMNTLKILAEEREREYPLGIYCGSLFGYLRNSQPPNTLLYFSTSSITRIVPDFSADWSLRLNSLCNSSPHMSLSKFPM